MTPVRNPPPSPSQADGLALGQFLEMLWEGRWILLGCVVPCLFLAWYYLWRTTPVYRVDALLQVGSVQVNPDRSPLEARVNALFADNAQVQAEAEIMQSNQVLGRVVEAFHLDLIATPVADPWTGTALFRGRPDAPRLEVAAFDLPEAALGQSFFLTAQGGGDFTWSDRDGKVLAKGRAGEEIQAPWQGQPMRLMVRSLAAKPGQRFFLQRQQPLDAINALRADLTIEEKGKDTSILSLAYLHPDPVLGAKILNAILDQNNLGHIERQTAGAASTLAFLRGEVARVREKQSRAKQLLDKVQGSSRSGDLVEEARVVLQRSVDIDKEVLDLRQKRDDLLRSYEPHSDVVESVDRQIAKLQEEGRRLDAQGKRLPHTQQEVIGILRDVQDSQDQYTSLSNLETVTTEQVQMAKAGETSNARIVDRAVPTRNPVRPNRGLVMAIGLALGLIGGGGLTLLRRVLFPKGVEDPQALELQFELPVLATIPHSGSQLALARKSRKNGGQLALLSAAEPQDLAVESLRSLRTALTFSLVDAPNRAVMIAGASPGIGKSFVAANFAAVMAQSGARVLLVDADMRKGQLHRLFGAMPRKDGLSEILAGNLAWQAALHQAHGLDLITTGTLPPDPSKLLHAASFGSFLAEVCASYDYVILDAPPVLAVTDASIIGTHMGVVLMVVKDGRNSVGEIQAALRCLDLAGIQAKGFIFNDMNPQNIRLGYHRYGYEYVYQK